MTKDEALKLAKECGATTYTNRHYPEATAVTFSPVAWEKFCEQALAAPVQEPVALLNGIKRYEPEIFREDRIRMELDQSGEWVKYADVELLITTPPAQPAVPDAMTSADIQEHIEYVAGWNDCRAAMLEMMK